MARLQSQLRAFEEGRWVHLLNYDEVPPRRQKVITEMQAGMTTWPAFRGSRHDHRRTRHRPPRKNQGPGRKATPQRSTSAPSVVICSQNGVLVGSLTSFRTLSCT
jgi:hypothetical protein